MHTILSAINIFIFLIIYYYFIIITTLILYIIIINYRIIYSKDKQ